MQNEIYSNELKTVCNAVIQIGDIDDTGKGRHFVSKFIQDGLVKIEGHGIVLLKKETIDQSLQSMVGAPVIIKHQDVTNENADELRCGVISKAYFNDFDGWYYCEGIIWDEKAKELVNNGWSVSCSYDFLAYNDEGGVENNIKYDKEFTQLNFTHLAIVDNPRYERANIVFNSKDNDDGEWITVKGTHIFIKNGQSKEDAVKEFIERKRSLHHNTKKTSENFAKHVESAVNEVNQKGYLSAKTAEAIGSQLHYVPKTEKIQEIFGDYEKYSKDKWGFNSKRMQSILTKYEEDLKDRIRFEIERAYEPTSERTMKEASEGISDILGHDVTEKDLSQAWKALPKHSNGMRDTGIFPELLKKNLGLEKDNYDRWLSLMGRNIHIKEGQSLADAIEERGEDKSKFKEYIDLLDNDEIKNAKDSDSNGKWITIKGNHIFIPDGKTLDEVIKEKGWGDKENKQSDSENKHGFKKDKDSGYYMKDLSDGTSVYVEKKEGGQGEKEPFYLEATHFDKDGKTIAKKQYHYDSMDGMFNKIDKDFVSKDKQSDVEKTYKVGSKFVQEDIYGKEEHTVKEVKKDIWGDTVVVDETGYQHHLNQIKPIQEDKQSSEEVYKREGRYQIRTVDVRHKEKLESLPRISDVGKDKYGNTTLTFKEKSDYAGELDAYLTQNGIYTNGILGISDDNKDEDVRRHSEARKRENKDINNSKEQDMKILDELKKLISKVENEKGEQDMDEKEKVDNENVDKRKLIDEVAGIMKSAGCDDEDIRTAIGKMEKIGYDKSEAGSADNKKVKNEEPDKKEDKEVDNEDAEDKKEADDLKEDEKEDVKNKCKNSKSSFDKINEIYNSVKQIEKETGYVSRQQKLDNAVEYFK